MTVTEDQFLILLHIDVINVVCQDKTWVIDSGVTTHATLLRDYATLLRDLFSS